MDNTWLILSLPEQLQQARHLLDKYDSPRNRATLQKLPQCGIFLNKAVLRGNRCEICWAKSKTISWVLFFFCFFFPFHSLDSFLTLTRQLLWISLYCSNQNKRLLCGAAPAPGYNLAYIPSVVNSPQMFYVDTEDLEFVLCGKGAKQSERIAICDRQQSHPAPLKFTLSLF